MVLISDAIHIMIYIKYTEYNSSASDNLLNEKTFFVPITETISAPDLFRDKTWMRFDQKVEFI